MLTASNEQLFDAAKAHHDANRLGHAEPLYRQILSRDPNHADALHGLALVAYASGHPDDALRLMQRVVQLKPADAIFQGNLGLILAGVGRVNEAMAAYRRAVVMKPDFAEAHSNLGAALLSQYQFEQALAEFSQAVSLRPNFGAAYSNLGNTLRELGRVPEAVAALRHAASLAPGEPTVIWNLAFALLLNGELREGWQAFEARWQMPKISMHREIRGVLWDGRPLDGKTILLHDEQGQGDTIQFIRYVPMVRARGGNVIVSCPPSLGRLLAGQPGAPRIISDNTQIEFHTHCALLSLPRLMDTTLDNIPAASAYLAADPALAQNWKAKLDSLPGRLKIGLSWAGSPLHTRDRIRSMQLAELVPLAQVKDVAFINLQKVPPLNQPPPAGMNLVDWTDQIDDFADTAALISQLDLIISVDTAIVHLAGALGKPVWMLTPFSPDWRWLMERPDSPWYPSLRLFRQVKLWDWQTPVQQVTAALKALVN